ncbi:MAG TPA: hypothetical protein VK852_13815 [Desulfobacterales bacterium]|jgi:methyl-accepting chemotaxis protein|nr:hypothetical protein [Desulfobacterales bacterium]
MDASITLAELGMIILFLVVLTAGVYAVITLRNINAVSSEFSALLRRHRSDLDQLSKSVPHIAEISANAAEVSREAKLRVHEVGKAIETISRDTTDTVLRVNETADQVARYVMLFGEIAKALIELFPGGKRS